VSGLQALAQPGAQSKTFKPRLTPRSLGNELQGFGIRAHTLRIGPQCVKGYELADFDEAFVRFLKEM
jgi:hypothetical protein